LDAASLHHDDLALLERSPPGLFGERHARRKHYALLRTEVDGQSFGIHVALLCRAAAAKRIKPRRCRACAVAVESPVAVDKQCVAIGVKKVRRTERPDRGCEVGYNTEPRLERRRRCAHPVLAQAGRPQFEPLRRRLAFKRPEAITQAARDCPAAIFAFDLLERVARTCGANRCLSARPRSRGKDDAPTFTKQSYTGEL
jgi:hypothetical protein